MDVARKNSHRNRREEPSKEAAVVSGVKKEKRSFIGTLLELPQAPQTPLSQIELLSNREALIDGCKGVLEYNEKFVRLSLGNMTVRFCGRNLQLRSMSEECVAIDGFLQSIDFLT